MINLTDLTDDFAGPVTESKPSFTAKLRAGFDRAFMAIVASRQARADRVVRGYLGQHNDAQLARMGFTPRQIDALRNPASPLTLFRTS